MASLPLASVPNFLLALTDDEFAARMAECGPFPAKPRMVVAVSGGPDSTALTLLAQRWLQKRGGSLLALTIDHRLRESSGQEASALGLRLAGQGIDYRILTWDHAAPPQSAVHASARKARYGLLLDACRAENISHLLLGHHAEDQAETILMRLSKSTGIDGLAGMSLAREQDGITLLRPLLPVRKARLEATCAQAGWKFFSDPSNSAEPFARARLRAMQDSLARAGFTVEKLLEVARDAGLARAQLEETANQWLITHASLSSYGVATLSHKAWLALDHAMQLRILSRVLRCVGGGDYPPRGSSLERLSQQLTATENNHHTLGGCRITLQGGSILFTREEGLIEKEAPLTVFTTHRRWDNRFLFSIPKDFACEGVTVRPLGSAGRSTLAKMGAAAVAALPKAQRAGLPGFFGPTGLLFVPNFEGKDAALSRQSLGMARFSPVAEFLVKPFRPASFRMT